MIDMERAWVAECSRCANEGISYEDDEDMAHVDLRGRGWTKGRAVYCPECSRKETK